MSSRTAKSASLALILAMLGLDAVAEEAVRDYSDCYCTNRGERVEIGQTSCLDINGRQFSARCFMSENTPGWRRLDEGCTDLPLAGTVADDDTG